MVPQHTLPMSACSFTPGTFSMIHASFAAEK